MLVIDSKVKFGLMKIRDGVRELVRFSRNKYRA